jgi:hypothetical protein
MVSILVWLRLPGRATSFPANPFVDDWHITTGLIEPFAGIIFLL